MPSHAPVAVALEVDAVPELRLRDRRQRPLGVDVDRVAVHERHVLVEVEHDPVHPARDEPVEAAEPRLGLAHLGADEQPQLLDRQRGDVVVGLDALDDTAWPADGHRRGDPAAVEHSIPTTGEPSRSVDAEVAQVGRPTA